MSHARDLPTLPGPSSPFSQWRSAFAGRLRAERSTAGAATQRPPWCGGRYRLLHKLGEGGTGEVWCAEQVGLRRRVALKFLRRDLQQDPEACQRFARECRIAASASHPGVVEVFDVIEAGGTQPFLVMQLLDGVTLAELVQAHGPLRPQRTVRLLATLARALAHLHANGICHGDVNPANVMVASGRGRGGLPEVCKLIGFGLAGREGESVSRPGVGGSLGNPAYMSPEQLRGAGPEPQSDTYALGCVAYFMLAEAAPFQGRTSMDTTDRTLRAAAPALPRLRTSQGVQERLQAVVNRACQQEAADRFESAHQFAEALTTAAREPEPRRRTLRQRVADWMSAAAIRS